MKEFTIKTKIIKKGSSEFDKVDFSDEAEQCNFKECTDMSVGYVGSEFFRAYFCENHTVPLEEINKFNKDYGVHQKVKYHLPQPIPKDIQALSDKTGAKGLRIYAVDALSLDSYRAMLNKALTDKNVFEVEGEIDVTLSDTDEN